MDPQLIFASATSAVIAGGFVWALMSAKLKMERTRFERTYHKLKSDYEILQDDLNDSEKALETYQDETKREFEIGKAQLNSLEGEISALRKQYDDYVFASREAAQTSKKKIAELEPLAKLTFDRRERERRYHANRTAAKRNAAIEQAENG